MGEEMQTVSHDIPMAEHLKQALAAGLGPRAADAAPGPRRRSRPYAAARRAALSRALPGPADRRRRPAACKVRANDTDYPFRAASCVHLAHRRDRRRRRAGDDAERRRARGDALHRRVRPARRGRLLHQPHARRGLGRQRAPTVAGHRRRRSAHPRPARCASSTPTCCAASTGASTRCRTRPTLRWPGARRAAPGQGRLGARPAALRLRGDRPRLRRRGARAAQRRRPHRRARRALAGGHVLAARPARGQRGRLHLDRRLGTARHDAALVAQPRRRSSPGSLLLADMGVETDELYTADVTRTMPVVGEWTPDAAAGLPRGAGGAGRRHRRGEGRRRLPRRAQRGDVGARRPPALVGHPARAGRGVVRRRPRPARRRAAPPLHAARHLAHARHRRARLRRGPRRALPRRHAARRARA